MSESIHDVPEFNEEIILPRESKKKKNSRYINFHN